MPHPFAKWMDPITIWFMQHQWAAITVDIIYVLLLVGGFLWITRRREP